MQILSVRFLWIIDSQTRCSPYFIPKCVVFILRFCHPINCVQGRTSLKWTKKWGGTQCRNWKKGFTFVEYIISIWAHSTENIYCQWNRNLIKDIGCYAFWYKYEFHVCRVWCIFILQCWSHTSFGLTEWDHSGLEGAINY